MLTTLRTCVLIAATTATPLLSACGGGSDSGTDPTPPTGSPAGFLVGSWRAESLILTNQANPEQSTDIVAEFGAIFTLDVQESGRYLAILTGFGQSSSESGTLSLSGDIVTFRREFPSAQTDAAVVRLEGSRVIMDGETTFDFNSDGLPEDADLHAVLVPR